MSSVNSDNTYLRTFSEMPSADREFGEDAGWKRIQQNTFTRWVNEHLKVATKQIGNLETDLSDGLRLVSLIEVLSGKRILKYNKRPTFRSQKLENVSVCLDFLGNEEGIKIVNIDSTDIIDCNLKLILGLVWMLILHYSITIPSWDVDEITVETSSKKKGHEATPKQKLLSWIQSRIPDLTVTNFTSDWNDGKAIGALVDAVAPGLCPDWPDYDSRNALDNAVEAMQLAEEWLSVPQLIKPREMVNLNVDELSMMTYLSQFPNAKPKPNAPLRPRTNPSKVRVHGPGVEPTGVIAGTPAKFTVETFSAGRGQVEASMKNFMDDTEHQVDIRFNDDRNLTYTCTYTPPSRGTYLVDVKFAGREVARSPFRVYVEELTGDASKCVAQGSGLDGQAKIGHTSQFRVYTKDAGKGRLECFLCHASCENEAKPITIRESSVLTQGGEYLCEYTPTLAGPHQIHVTFEGKHIPGSPFDVTVDSGVDVSKMYVTGRGVQAKGIRARDKVDFTLHLPEPVAVATLSARVISPSRAEEPCKMISSTEVKPLANGTLHHISPATSRGAGLVKVSDVKYQYTPSVEGKYSIEISCEDTPIPKTPFYVDVMKYKESRIKAFGPGLEEGLAGSSANFSVETNGETGALEFAIEGPSQTKIECVDNGDGSAEVSYIPHVVGEYGVRILCDGQDIPGSPFMAQIADSIEGFHPDRVKVYGDGLDGSKIALNQVNEFYIDTTQAIVGASSPYNKSNNSTSPKVTLLDPKYELVPVKVERYTGPDLADRVYKCTYVPNGVGKHVLWVSHCGTALPKSPWKIQVRPPCHPEKVIIHGQCIKTCCAQLGQVCEFTIDASLAGTGDIKVVVLDANQKAVLADLKEVSGKPGVYKVEFLASTRGLHTAQVYFGDREVLEKPLEINVEPSVNTSLIKINELESNVLIGSASEIVIDASLIEKRAGTGNVKCVVEYATHIYTDAYVENKQDGTYIVYFNPKEEGLYKVDISYDGVPLFAKPYEIVAKNGCDPSKVKATGPGLSKGYLNQPCKFLVDTRKAGLGGLGLTIEGPSEAKMSCRDNRDGTCSVEYFPTEPGDYDIMVKFQDVPITGSPFMATIYDIVDVDKIMVWGDGLKTKNFRSGIPTKFVVDASRAGNGTLEVILKDAKTGKLCPEQPVISRVTEEYSNISDLTMNGASPNFATVSRTGHYSPPHSPPPPGDEGLTPQGSPRIYRVWVTPPIPAHPTDRPEFTLEAKFGGEAIPTLPPLTFTPLPPVDASAVVVCGPGTGDKSLLASLPSHVIIDTRDAGRAVLDVITEDPQGRLLPGYLREKRDQHFGNDEGRGVYQYTYTPHSAGPHSVKVLYDGQLVPNTPFTVNAQVLGDATKAIILANFPPTSPIRINPRREQCFKVDARPLGGTGQSPVPAVTCLAVRYDITAPPVVVGEAVDVVDNADDSFTVFLNFERVGTYKVETNLGGRPIPGGTLDFLVEEFDEPDEGAYVMEYIKQVSQYAQFRTVEFCLPPLPASDLSSIQLQIQASLMTAEVTSPTGKMGLPKITSNTDGTINLRYHPSEPGLHQIDIKYKNEPVQGSPYQFYVDRMNDSNITAWGPGLSHGSSGEACNFTIVTKDAGAGGLAMTVEGPSKAEISCHDNKDGTCGVTYVPVQPGEYKVNVKFNDKHISGSPFTVKITGEGKKRAQLSVGSANEISLKIDEPDIKKLKATIRAPNGVEDACMLKKLPNGNIGVSFTPHVAGEHTLHVLKEMEPIKGSPFSIMVKPGDLGDASKVKLSGPGLKEAKTQATNTFRVDTKSAGYGGLSVSLEGPSRAVIECVDKEPGICDISYVVTQPGTYFLNIKFADNHVPGSPFRIEVKGKGSEMVKGSIRSEQKAPENTKAGSSCELNLKLQDTDPLDLSAQVTGPSSSTEDCDIVPTSDGRFSIKFTPKELGVHSVSVKYKGQHIHGSPFPFTVGEIKRADGGTGAHKVKAYGFGLVNAEVNTKAEFNVNTHEAGSGVLTVAIEGPGKSDIQYEDLKNGSCAIQYTCSEVGEYLIRVNFNDKPIPDSPFKVYVQPPMGEARKITTSSMEDHISAIGKPVTFNVNMNGTRGHLEAKVVSPSGQEDDCYIIPSGDDSYMVRFVPKAKGTHYVHVKFNNVHIRHSPFRIKVGKETEGDPFKVQVSGKGLHAGRVGKPNEFFVNTTKSGAGVLAVTVDGPSKTAVSSREEQEGYAIDWTPQTPGNYYISVKFSGHHISGSPFKAVVEGAGAAKSSDKRETSTFVVETVTKSSSSQKEIALPKFNSDASKVETRGIGLQKAFMNKHNSFLVNCSKAGNDLLTVNVWGASGPCQEVSTSTIARMQFQVTYVIREKGDLFLIVKYGNKNVPGESFLLVGIYNPDSGLPCESLSVKHEGDHVYSVNYEISNPGQYVIVMKWGDSHVQGSPFTVNSDLYDK